VTIYGYGFSGEATPAPLGSVVPIQGTFRIENVPGGHLYKIDAETPPGPFVARPVHCTKEVDLRDDQFIIGGSYGMFMQPWSVFNSCNIPPSS
jgi:hypothetical protein